MPDYITGFRQKMKVSNGYLAISVEQRYLPTTYTRLRVSRSDI
jgi:hypothetical protein